MSLTKAEQRRQRKRARAVRTSNGGYTSHHRAQEVIAENRATLNASGELVFRSGPPVFIVRPIDDGLRYQWQAGMSGGYAIMKTHTGMQL